MFDSKLNRGNKMRQGLVIALILGAVILFVACQGAVAVCRDPVTGIPSVCVSYPFECTNGTAADGTANAPDTQRCSSCNNQYKVENSQCVPTQYTCTGGVRRTGRPPGNEDVEHCTACTIPGVNPDSNNRCVAASFSYICTNGTASSLRDAIADGLSRCVSCDPHFFTLMGTSGEIGTTCQSVAEVGAAVRIGTVRRFDVSETTPRDLAAIRGILYMVGSDTDALYTLDTTTGVATKVSDTSVTEFGVGEGNPTGLAAINDTLYMVGWNNDVLYTLNIDSTDGSPDGRAYRVGSTAAGFDVGESVPTGLAAINNILYMVGTTNDALYTLDTTTGGAAQVGSVSAGFNVGETNPRGLAAIGTTLYMVGLTNADLYTLDTTDGDATQMGSATQFGATESSPTGLAAIGTALYMVGAAHDALFALRYQ